MVFTGLNIALVGRFKSGWSQKKISDLIRENNGTESNVKDPGCTHIVTTGAYLPKAKADAGNPDAKFVKLEWVLESVKKGKAQNVEMIYAFDSEVVPKIDGTGKKRIAEEDAEEEEEEEEEKPKKRKRGKEKQTEAGAEPKTVTTGRGRPKEAAEKAASKAKQSKKASAKTVPIDELFGARDSHKVYIDESDGTIYDVMLNQTNIGANNNKFYYIQLLETLTEPGKFGVWTRWGRVEENGQHNFAPNLGLDAALKIFRKKFKDKSGLEWEKRKGPPKAGKYTLIEKNYVDKDENEREKKEPTRKAKDGKKAGLAQSRPECQLSPELQDLVSFIFNGNNMKSSMASLNYNFNKLPLGELSKRTIEQGYLALKELGAVIANPSLALKQYKQPVQNVYDELTSRYYTVIPHDFGRQRPVVINNEEILKKEITLVETLGNMEIANEIIKETEGIEDEDGKLIHPLDAQFQSLGLEEVVPLDKSSDEFMHLEGYFNHSKKYGASANAEIQQIYRITRPEENKRFAESFSPEKLTGKAKDCRKLLWHGSRGGNFGGILSQGLRIAPPEAPVNGYAFGKGVYLADRSCKSAAYCDPWTTSDNTGLLLLCEVQLGDPPYVKTHHEFDAKDNVKEKGLLSAKYLENPKNEPPKWMDAGLVNGEFKGAQLPDHRTPLPSHIGNPNEYIVYSVAQVKVKYVFKLKWSGRVTWGIG